MGRRRENWDMVAVLRHTIIHSFNKPKQEILPEDLNPIRQAEMDYDDQFFEGMEKALKQ